MWPQCRAEHSGSLPDPTSYLRLGFASAVNSAQGDVQQKALQAERGAAPVSAALPQPRVAVSTSSRGEKRRKRRICVFASEDTQPRARSQQEQGSLLPHPPGRDEGGEREAERRGAMRCARCASRCSSECRRAVAPAPCSAAGSGPAQPRTAPLRSRSAG